MASSGKELGALDAQGQRPRDGHASVGEQRTASGTSAGEWLVNVADDVVVPMTTAEVVEGFRTGKLAERSLVWRIGMHDWTTLVEVPQLRLAAGAHAPPLAARSLPQPVAVHGETQRRRNTLPFGFPAVRDPATVQQPAGLSLLPALATPVSAPRMTSPTQRAAAEETEALAVYERPVASLTFSDSVRAEWQGTPRVVPQAASAPPRAPSIPSARPLTPLAPVTARLPQTARSGAPHSLVPTTVEAEHRVDSRAVSPWGDRSVVLASELRAVKATSKRSALWAALGAAAVASAFTLWLVRTPTPHAAEAPLAAATPAVPVAALAPAPTLEALAAPSAAPAAVSAPPLAARRAVKRAAPRKVVAALAPPVSEVPVAVDATATEIREATAATPAPSAALVAAAVSAAVPAPELEPTVRAPAPPNTAAPDTSSGL